VRFKKHALKLFQYSSVLFDDRFELNSDLETIVEITRLNISPELHAKLLNCSKQRRNHKARVATSSSFRVEGAIFMHFHSTTSSCLFNRGTTFSQTVTDMSFSQHFRKWELISLNQARNYGDEAHSKNFFAPLEKCVGHSLKLLDIVQNFGHSQKSLIPFWCPKLVTGLLLIKVQTELPGQSEN